VEAGSCGANADGHVELAGQGCAGPSRQNTAILDGLHQAGRVSERSPSGSIPARGISRDVCRGLSMAGIAAGEAEPLHGVQQRRHVFSNKQPPASCKVLAGGECQRCRAPHANGSIASTAAVPSCSAVSPRWEAASAVMKRPGVTGRKRIPNHLRRMVRVGPHRGLQPLRAQRGKRGRSVGPQEVSPCLLHAWFKRRWQMVLKAGGESGKSIGHTTGTPNRHNPETTWEKWRLTSAITPAANPMGGPSSRCPSGFRQPPVDP